MASRAIEIRGARTHHLKSLDLDLPREAFTVVCGVSGSGKSSLVLDTLGAESYRRFLGTLARGGAEGLSKPDVDRIDGLPPAVAAGFLSRAPGPRETLATVTEIADGLRLLFARAATPHCPRCGDAVRAQAPERAIEDLLGRPEGTRVVLLAPRGRGAEALEAVRRDGFVRARVGGRLLRLDDTPAPAAGPDEAVEAVIDRLVVRKDARPRFADSVEQGFRAGGGVLRALVEPGPGVGGAPGAATATLEVAFADRPFCGRCGVTYPPLSPRLFSPDAPAGACPSCDGLGETTRPDPEKVLPRDARFSRAAARVLARLPKDARAATRRAFARALESAGVTARDRVAALPEEVRARLLGSESGTGLLATLALREVSETFAGTTPCGRLAPYPSAALLTGRTLPAWLALPGAELRRALGSVALEGAEGALARPALEDVRARCAFLEEVGLGYLAPSRSAASLSGGELRRARLAGACAARMSGLLYLLDEPSMGLHPADREPLRRRLRALVAEGNTVVCVEHDPEVIGIADHFVELGPGAGAEGGRIVEEGPAQEVLRRGTAPVLVALRSPAPPRASPRSAGPWIRVKGARHRTLRDVDASFHAAGLTCVTGVSGAGKTTLVLDVLAPAARAVVAGAPFPSDRLVALEGLEGFDRVSVSDAAPSRHARATPGSVLGVLDPLRSLFAATVEARSRGYGPSRFSTNVKGGRCEACQGLGTRSIRLRHLPDLAAACDACGGRRFGKDTLEVRVKGLSIADVLETTLARAAEIFRDLRGVGSPLQAATDVGLGYVPLGEPTERMSGGEALRLRLASALGRAGRARTLYLLDEPCAGLHPKDVLALADLLLRLSSTGNAIVAVEHHPELIRRCDHVVDLGPGPGAEGGRLVGEGPPAALAASSSSRTGRRLR